MSYSEVHEKKGKKENVLSRRDFFRVAGLTAGAAGLATLSGAKPALAGEKPEGIICDFAVREVEKPTYMNAPYADSDKLKRYDYRNAAFEHPELMKQKFGGKYWAEAAADTKVKLANRNDNGNTALDWALDQASWASYFAGHMTDYANPGGLLSWEPLYAPLHPDLKRWEADPKDNNRYVKKAAHFFGAGPVGIAALNEQWVYSHSGFQGSPPIVLSDTHDKPSRNEKECIIPRRMNRVIVMSAPSDGMLFKYSPTTLGGAEASHGYSRMMELAGKLSQFIKYLGYDAVPLIDCGVLLIPTAIDAGLGELGRNGCLINPELGQNLRLTAVLTDMPITVDKPIEFGVAEFCKRCKKCARMCPSEAISTADDTSYDVPCISNNPGMKKYYIDSWKCLTYWIEGGPGCSNCISVCPYSKPATWIHDIVKGVSSRTTVFNSLFVKLDDVMGYGGTFEKHDNPREWWESEGRPKTWPKRF